MTDSSRKSRTGKSARAASVGELLESALRSHGIRRRVSRYSGFHLWPEVVGAEVAAVAQPLRIVRGNVLQMKVVDPVWAQELALRKHELLEKLAGGVLGSVIEDIQFIIEGPGTR
jgi:predicted nucleic acid-binding Zn ribbon protein